MIAFAAIMYYHGDSQCYWYCSYLIVIDMELKTDILNKATFSVSVATSSN